MGMLRVELTPIGAIGPYPVSQLERPRPQQWCNSPGTPTPA